MGNTYDTRDVSDLPLFAEGKLANIQLAVTRGIITQPAYFFATDKNQIGYVDSNLVVHLPEVGSSTGESTGYKSVQRVPALPSAGQASNDIIYIFNNIAYLYNDGVYDPLGKDYSDELKDIKLDIANIKSRLYDIEISGTGGGGGITEAATVSQFPATGKINHTYIALQENAMYRWDSENLVYKCIGRDYMNIKQINGGSAEVES